MVEPLVLVESEADALEPEAELGISELDPEVILALEVPLLALVMESLVLLELTLALDPEDELVRPEAELVVDPLVVAEPEAELPLALVVASLVMVVEPL